MMALKEIIVLVAAMVIASSQACGSGINMAGDNTKDSGNNITFGVNVDGLNYTVTIMDGRLQKVMLYGNETSEFVSETDFDTLIELMTRYNEMSWMDRLMFMVHRMKVPIRYVFTFKDLLI